MTFRLPSLAVSASTAFAPPPADKNSDPHYVFDLATAADGSLVAASGSDLSIAVFARDTLSPLTRLRGHEGQITDIVFSPASAHVLASSSNDQSIGVWDVRSGSQVATLGSDGSGELCSVSVSLDGTHVAAGTVLGDEDAKVLVWDARTGGLVQEFVDTHEKDVVRVRFHPVTPRLLGSGSVDGLVCVYDLSIADADDAVISILNSESSVSSFGFFGAEGEYVHCLTHTETFLVFNAAESETLVQYKDVRAAVEQCGAKIDYLVGCHYQAATGRLYLVGGSHSGDVEVMHVNKAEMQHAASLRGGHAATVRCAEWGYAGDGSPVIVTGGEDSRVVRWDIRGGFSGAEDAPVPMETDGPVRRQGKSRGGREHSHHYRPY